MCVQRFDDSLNSAIHNTYRVSLRSSSMQEPRDPLFIVLIVILLFCQTIENEFIKHRWAAPDANRQGGRVIPEKNSFSSAPPKYNYGARVERI